MHYLLGLQWDAKVVTVLHNLAFSHLLLLVRNLISEPLWSSGVTPFSAFHCIAFYCTCLLRHY